MTKFGQQVLALVVIVVITIIAAESRARRRYCKYLSGYWIAHPDFAETAAVSEFQLFIAPPRGRGRKRQGYLLIVDSSGKTAVNQAIELVARSRAQLACAQSQKTTADEFQGRLDIDYGGAEPPGALPSQMRMSLSVLNGTLTLFDSDRVYACLVKDFATTDSALRAYESEDDVAQLKPPV